MAGLEKYGFTSYLFAVPEINKRMLKGRVPHVKEILSSFSILTIEELLEHMDASQRKTIETGYKP